MHGWQWHGQLLFGGALVGAAWDVVGKSVVGVVMIVGVVIGVVGVVMIVVDGVVIGGIIVASEVQVRTNWSMKSQRWLMKLKNWNGGHSRTKSTTPAPFPAHCQ